jgi:hypothetical protein
MNGKGVIDSIISYSRKEALSFWRDANRSEIRKPPPTENYLREDLGEIIQHLETSSRS